jgi:hypothetical protein
MMAEAFETARRASTSEGAPGLAAVAAMVIAEMTETVTPGQARGFFHAIGRRLAAMQPLDDANSTAELTGRINTFWRMLDWGEAELVLERDAIVVRHRYAPRETALVEGNRWPLILLAILEGAYAAWFEQLGSGPALGTVAEWHGDLVEIRHGA